MAKSEIAGRINQIADFFRGYPHEEAVEGIEQHIREFWDPRMLRELSAALLAGGEGIDELALEAARRAMNSPGSVHPAA